MGYHGGVFLTSGGFYSLDMFFALSGFLITSLLISEWHRTQIIRLGRFWARRARRLLPALLVMLLGVAVFAAFVVPAGTYPTLRGDAFSALFYYANWHFIAIGSNYFDQTALTSPLTHTWSLAVEEQFYLVWPLVVLGVFKFWKSTRALLVVCVVGALASAIEMAVLYSPGDVNRLYYGTDTRAQSLLVGAALAVGLSLWADHRRRPGGSGGDRAAPPLTGRRSRLGRADRTGAGGRAHRRPGRRRGQRPAVDDGELQRPDRLPRRLPAGGPGHLGRALQRRVLTALRSGSRPVLRSLRYVGRISYGMYLWHFPLSSTSTMPGPVCRLFPLRRAGRRHAGRRHRVLLSDRAAHPAGDPAAGLAFVGGRPGGRGRHRVAVVAATNVPAIAAKPPAPPPRARVAAELRSGRWSWGTPRR